MYVFVQVGLFAICMHFWCRHTWRTFCGRSQPFLTTQLFHSIIRTSNDKSSVLSAFRCDQWQCDNFFSILPWSKPVITFVTDCSTFSLCQRHLGNGILLRWNGGGLLLTFKRTAVLEYCCCYLYVCLFTEPSAAGGGCVVYHMLSVSLCEVSWSLLWLLLVIRKKQSVWIVRCIVQQQQLSWCVWK